MAVSMSLQEWLTTLEQRHPSEIDLGLTRVRLIAERLGITRPHGTVITVAGTNGKGSCVRMLEALLNAQGASTGVYSSPHLINYNERIRLNGVDASDEAIVSAFEAIERVRGDVGLSYFEAGTLAAMWLFDQLRVDYWLLEVGLGGRLDAVNVLDADISIVTSIAIDHEAWLGSDRSVIAREKLGVARPGRPLFVGETDLPAGMREHADLLACDWFGLDDSFSYSANEGLISLELPQRDTSKLTFPNLVKPELPMPSVMCALAAVSWLGVLPDEAQLAKVLAETSLKGRLQKVHSMGRSWLLDVGHNPAAANYLVQHASVMQVEHIVLGMVHDKDVGGTVDVLREHFAHWYLATPDAGGREAQSEELASLLKGVPNCQAFGSVKDAMESALANTVDGDTILVMGSFFTVGAALEWLDGQSDAK